MAMTIQNVIDGLRADIELGRYKPDDVLVIDWFSYHDVLRVVNDYEEGRVISDDKARTIWEGCVDAIDTQLDQYETEAINNVIDAVVGEA
jgi:hypothetical protein